ncbi:hypothetical protein C0J52_25336 [Blattella germanica]|nr:hypothetical protein C0J52_25336 [Blattella germanica]
MAFTKFFVSPEKLISTMCTYVGLKIPIKLWSVNETRRGTQHQGDGLFGQESCNETEGTGSEAKYPCVLSPGLTSGYTIIVSVINITTFLYGRKKKTSAGWIMPVHFSGINLMMNSTPSGTVELYTSLSLLAVQESTKRSTVL